MDVGVVDVGVVAVGVVRMGNGKGHGSAPKDNVGRPQWLCNRLGWIQDSSDS